MKMPTTYTVLSMTGDVVELGLSLRDAADAMMTSDSREWEIRHEKGSFTVYSLRPPANEGWAPTAIWSFAASREEAEREICEKIVAAIRWPGHREAMPDAEYDAIIAALAMEQDA